MSNRAVPSSIEMLYCDHHSWLRGWLSKKLGNGHQAADLAQDTFVRLLAKEDTPVLQEPRAFLTTVAKRVLANHWRREQLEQAYLEALANVPEAYAISPEEQAILLESLVEIDRLLNGLPTIVKRAFLLTQLDGLNHAEVATELGISMTTVKRYLAKAAQQCFFADVFGR
jgi:RNA polymerase sigma factor (sigma-70 family)